MSTIFPPFDFSLDFDDDQNLKDLKHFLEFYNDKFIKDNQGESYYYGCMKNLCIQILDRFISGAPELTLESQGFLTDVYVTCCERIHHFRVSALSKRAKKRIDWLMRHPKDVHSKPNFVTKLRERVGRVAYWLEDTNYDDSDTTCLTDWI